MRLDSLCAHIIYVYKIDLIEALRFILWHSSLICLRISVYFFSIDFIFQLFDLVEFFVCAIYSIGPSHMWDSSIVYEDNFFFFQNSMCVSLFVWMIFSFVHCWRLRRCGHKLIRDYHYCFWFFNDNDCFRPCDDHHMYVDARTHNVIVKLLSWISYEMREREKNGFWLLNLTVCFNYRFRPGTWNCRPNFPKL